MAGRAAVLAAGDAVSAAPAELPRVAVLLSSYNGARFLAEQLDSIAGQTGVEVLLHARDDGSSDPTPDILRANSDRWPNLAGLVAGENLGPARSFLELLRTAPDDAEYFAFCDQDDVWFSDKLERAVAAIANDSGPALYCSNVMLADAALAALGPAPESGDTRFAHLLFENIAFGCTVVVNRAARELVMPHDPGEAAVMHDWWCALVIAAFGRIHYEPRPGVLYRQHGGNVVGQQGAARQAAREITRLLKGARGFYRIHAQTSALLRLYGAQLPAQHRALAERLVASRTSLRRRLAYALTGPVVRRRSFDAAVVRGLIAASWY